MILRKNRAPHVQYPMLARQPLTEAELPAGQEVAAVRVPAGAVIQGGILEIIDPFAATSTLAVMLVEEDGTETSLLAATSSTSAGFTALTGQVRTNQGGWVKLTTVNTDAAAGTGTGNLQVDYVVDGRFNEVMPETAALAPDDVAA